MKPEHQRTVARGILRSVEAIEIELEMLGMWHFKLEGDATMGSDKVSQELDALRARVEALEAAGAVRQPTNAADLPLPAGAGPDDVASGDVTLADEYKPLATAGSAAIDASGQRTDRPGQAPAYDAAGGRATHPDTAVTKQPKDETAPAAGKDPKKG